MQQILGKSPNKFLWLSKMCIFCFTLFLISPLYLKTRRRQKHCEQRQEGLGQRSCRWQYPLSASAGRPEERASLLLCWDKSRALTSSLSSLGSRKCCAKCFSNKSLEKNKHSNPLMSLLIPHLGSGFSKEPHAPPLPGPSPSGAACRGRLRTDSRCSSGPIQLPCVLLGGPTGRRLFQGWVLWPVNPPLIKRPCSSLLRDGKKNKSPQNPRWEKFI